jgi:hypothetical protein
MFGINEKCSSFREYLIFPGFPSNFSWKNQGKLLQEKLFTNPISRRRKVLFNGKEALKK